MSTEPWITALGPRHTVLSAAGEIDRLVDIGNLLGGGDVDHQWRDQPARLRRSAPLGSLAEGF